jgi:hypothetical protein
LVPLVPLRNSEPEESARAFRAPLLPLLVVIRVQLVD